MTGGRMRHHWLFKRGVPQGELWQLTELACRLASVPGRTSFLLTAPPLRLPGAVGSPVTPVATVEDTLTAIDRAPVDL
jgi:kynurenine formamidase